MCIVCPVVSAFTSFILGSYGPKDLKGKILAGALTVTLVALTIFQFKLSLCLDGQFNLQNAIRVVPRAALLAFPYSIGVNYLLGRFVFSPTEESAPQEKPCCCKRSTTK